MDPAKIDAIAAGMLGHGIETPPPDTRTLPELLCDEADTVIAMAERVLRGKYPTGSGSPEHHDPQTIEHHLYSSRRYLPAGASEAALRLSRLARDLRTEAAQWGAPCESTTETTKP